MLMSMQMRSQKHRLAIAPSAIAQPSPSHCRAITRPSPTHRPAIAQPSPRHRPAMTRVRAFGIYLKGACPCMSGYCILEQRRQQFFSKANMPKVSDPHIHRPAHGRDAASTLPATAAACRQATAAPVCGPAAAPSLYLSPVAGSRHACCRGGNRRCHQQRIDCVCVTFGRKRCSIYLCVDFSYVVLGDFFLTVLIHMLHKLCFLVLQ